MVLSRAEVRALLDQLPGTPELVMGLLYGCGPRATECQRLRIKDVDFGNRLVWVRQGKGGRDRCPKMVERQTTPLEVQESPGHAGVKTTEVCTHVLHAMNGRPPSPPDTVKPGWGVVTSARCRPWS